MDLTLTGLIGTELFVYLDDIVIYANALEEHEVKFNNLAERLRKANLHLQPDKCEFLWLEVGYLGHIIDKNRVRPDPKKIIAVKNFPVPKTQKMLALSRNPIDDNKEKSKNVQADDDTFMTSQEKMFSKKTFTRNKQENSKNKVKKNQRHWNLTRKKSWRKL